MLKKFTGRRKCEDMSKSTESQTSIKERIAKQTIYDAKDVKRLPGFEDDGSVDPSKVVSADMVNNDSVHKLEPLANPRIKGQVPTRF